MSPLGADKNKIVRDHITLCGLPCLKRSCLFLLLKGYFGISKVECVVDSSLFCFSATGDVGLVRRDGTLQLLANFNATFV